MRLPHVCGEVIKDLVAASPPVIEQKPQQPLFSEMCGGSPGKEFQGFAPEHTKCSSEQVSNTRALAPPLPGLEPLPVTAHALRTYFYIPVIPGTGDTQTVRTETAPALTV